MSPLEGSFHAPRWIHREKRSSRTGTTERSHGISQAHINACGKLYFFSSFFSGGGGGGGILKLCNDPRSARYEILNGMLTSGWLVGSPEPTCSQGEAASAKFLHQIQRGCHDVRDFILPVRLCKLEGFVYDSLLLLIISDLRVSLHQHQLPVGRCPAFD